MKRIIISLGLLFALQTAIFAQEQEDIVFYAHLLKTFSLNVLSGADQDFTFTTAADYNFGIVEGAGVDEGFTEITIEATGNWNLTIEAPDFIPYAGVNGEGTGIIPINNVGVWVESTGDHDIGTEVVCPYISLATAMGLATTPQMLIDLGTENSGDASDNAFTLNWQMGQNTACLNMNQLSMFDQMSAGDFGPGDFISTATLTLSEIP